MKVILPRRLHAVDDCDEDVVTDGDEILYMMMRTMSVCM